MAGSTATIRYNSKAGPLAWVDPSQGHAPPSLTYGFNDWQIKGDAPLAMTLSGGKAVRLTYLSSLCLREGY